MLDGAHPFSSLPAPLPKVFGFILTIVFATVLGPLIGGTGFFLVRVAIDIAQAQFKFADLPGMLILFMMGAYVVGGIIAFLAGTFVAIVALWRPPTLRAIIAAAVVANIVCFLTIQPGVTYGTGGLAVNLVASISAATICWAIFRSYLART
jgi:hypothetical protein